MFKEFFLKKLLESKLKDVPADQREKIMALIERKPELLMKVAQEVQEKMKQGKDQMSAIMEVMKAHESELREALQ